MRVSPVSHLTALFALGVLALAPLPPSAFTVGALAAPSRAPANAPVTPTATTATTTTTVSALPPGPLATTQNTLPVVFAARSAAGREDDAAPVDGDDAALDRSVVQRHGRSLGGVMR